MMDVFVVTVTVTITDEKKPEIYPIHRHDVYGIADTIELAADMLRAAMTNAGFRSSTVDTRLRHKSPTYINMTRNHTLGIVEEFEWLVERKRLNKYERI